jgi:hypothetical protein
MLMFQSGLLATFIPEVCMVIAFVLCLFTPGFKPVDSTSQQASIVAHVSSFEQRQTTTYRSSVYEFQAVVAPVPDKESSLSRYIEKVIPVTFEFCFSTSDGLSFVDFSRPPPAFLS